MVFFFGVFIIAASLTEAQDRRDPNNCGPRSSEGEGRSGSEGATGGLTDLLLNDPDGFLELFRPSRVTSREGVLLEILEKILEQVEADERIDDDTIIGIQITREDLRLIIEALEEKVAEDNENYDEGPGHHQEPQQDEEIDHNQ